MPHAVEEGQQPGDDRREHRDGEASRQAPEDCGGDSAPHGGGRDEETRIQAEAEAPTEAEAEPRVLNDAQGLADALLNRIRWVASPRVDRLVALDKTQAALLAAYKDGRLDMQSWVDDLQSGMYINCVYCGHRYGPSDEIPVSMGDTLKAHVEQCPDHPMSQLRAELDALRLKREDLQVLAREYRRMEARTEDELAPAETDQGRRMYHLGRSAAYMDAASLLELHLADEESK
jgi:hypothetical protein